MNIITTTTYTPSLHGAFQLADFDINNHRGVLNCAARVAIGYNCYNCLKCVGWFVHVDNGR